VPAGGEEVRFWDLAATEKKMLAKTNRKNDPDYTAGCRMKKVHGVYYVLDAQAAQIGPTDADNLIKNTASQDTRACKVRWEIEGGASGIRDNLHLVQLLAGYDCAGVRPEGDKIVRAKGLAAQALAGNVKLLRGDWNTRWLNHMHGQPELPHDDEMDAASGAFNELTDCRNRYEESDSETSVYVSY
jgi:predicted phage terminase large subunit-like protein